MPDPQLDAMTPPGPNQDPSEFLRQLRAAEIPLVLTLNGKAELVLSDAKDYQKLLEIAERAEDREDARVGIEELRAGKGVPVEDMFAEMRQILAKAKATKTR